VEDASAVAVIRLLLECKAPASDQDGSRSVLPARLRLLPNNVICRRIESAPGARSSTSLSWCPGLKQMLHASRVENLSRFHALESTTACYLTNTPVFGFVLASTRK
jgi:hypothetical protein